MTKLNWILAVLLIGCTTTTNEPIYKLDRKEGCYGLYIGDVVELKSGSKKMTISDFDIDNLSNCTERTTATVQWTEYAKPDWSNVYAKQRATTYTVGSLKLVDR